ncbi:unnamed protein product [Nippostrongylus brasiliensis]|uniref:Methyltransf_21 domain-containing protein n=1 Tax=Nippostrongylus brasiliensis TaxID=27835 RepID=A0A0N4XWL9_NIPBR|nr:unnamed protein product [Nippostrongylus brasiliensis]
MAVLVQNSYFQLWNYFPYYVNKCSPDGGLPILSFANNDEYKYHVVPTSYVEPTTDCTIVSLGIGKDIEAEKAMKAAMPNCKFWGADPVNDTNADIFTEGRFRYFTNNYDCNETVKYVDIATFLRNFVRRPVIDQIMIDIEHAEYAVLPFLLKSGQLAQDNIVICQVHHIFEKVFSFTQIQLYVHPLTH